MADNISQALIFDGAFSFLFFSLFQSSAGPFFFFTFLFSLTTTCTIIMITSQQIMIVVLA